MDPEAHAALVAALGSVDQLGRRFQVVVLSPPAAGSAASAEMADKLRAYAYDQAGMAIAAALDHLQAWRSLLQGAGEMPTYAHMTLLRTAHESALLAYWLTQPGIGTDTRRNRGVAAKAEDYEERRRFEDARGIAQVPPPAKLARERLSDLIAMAAKAGLVKVNTKGKEVLTVVLPATVELFDLYEPMDELALGRPQAHYRLCSGYAHAKQWALAQGAASVTAYDSSGRGLAVVQGVDSIAIDATQLAVAATERAVAAYEGLFRK